MAHPVGETRARAFAEFARLGQDLNQSTLAEMLGVSRARVSFLFKIWEKKGGINGAAAQGVYRNRESFMSSSVEAPQHSPELEDSRSLDASTVEDIIDQAVLAGLDFASMEPLKARQLIAAAESTRRGTPPAQALMAAGVSRAAAYAWLKDPKFRDFFDTQDGRYVGVATSRAFEIIKSGPASVAMSAIAFMLERRFPEQFGKKDRVDIHAQFESKVDIRAILSSPETIVAVSHAETLLQQDHARRLAAQEEIVDGEIVRDYDAPPELPE
jgi:hypothetical protein